jgi:phospholipase/lecithinase/hemolysin
MKTKIIAAGFVMFSAMLPLEAQAANFSGLYVFGDSISDTGNVFKLSDLFLTPGNPSPPSPPYFQGRFSNGPVWVDYLGQELGLQPTLGTDVIYNNAPAPEGINFAIGGSTSGAGSAVVPDPRFLGILAQVEGFVQQNSVLDPNALYAVVGGGNDFVVPITVPNDPNQPKSYQNMTTAVNTLAAAGARNFIVFQLPDFGKFPVANLDGRNPADITAATKEFNSNLLKNLAPLRQDPNIKVNVVNIYSLANSWFQNPAKFGFTNTTDACLPAATFTLCSNPGEYLFWDDIHLSTKAHKMIADAVFVPEPSQAIATLALGAVATLGMLKQKSQKSKLTAAGK